jgi:hypothetical protein
MNLRSLFEWVDTFPSSIAMRESLYGYPILLTAHVVTLAMFAGLVIMMDLRLLGFAYRTTPFSQVQARLFPWQMVGMVLSFSTGFLLFYSQPMRYYPRLYYWMKMALLVVAGLNALVFHLTTYRSVAKWDADAGPPSGAKLAGALSLVLWAGIVVSGRLTAYDWLTLTLD